MTPIIIAHLSDLHLSAEHHRNHIRRTRRALDYVRTLNVDHTVITGDITANGHPADYRIARSLFAASDLLDSSKLTVTIGNHDVYGGVHTAEDVLTFPKRCKVTDDKAKVRQFGYALRETFEHALRPSERRFFPFAKILDDVALIGVNTVAGYSRFHNPVGSNGDVDDKSFDQLVDILGSPLLQAKRKIVVLHHHFCKMRDVKGSGIHSVWGAIEKHTMKLRGKTRLLKLFARTNVELVLHGHVHESQEYVREGIRFVNAGGSILHDRSPDLHINVIQVTKAEMHVEIHRIAGQPPTLSQATVNESVLVIPEREHRAA
jgi:3',5'-cyclic AMP phosphodiesterase CpdA